MGCRTPSPPENFSLKFKTKEMTFFSSSSASIRRARKAQTPSGKEQTSRFEVSNKKARANRNFGEGNCRT